MPKRQNLLHMEKQILEHKVNVLAKIGQERNQYGLKKYREKDSFEATKPSTYLRYKNLYRKDLADEEDDVFKSSIDSKDSFLQEISKDTKDKEEDDFFIDPEKVESKKKKKKLSKKLKFKAFDEKSFTTMDGETIKFENPKDVKKRKRQYGKDFSTPELTEQKQLDPKAYKENVNFIPISEKANKLIQKKKRMEAKSQSSDEK